jgi:hypothetical protein
MIPTVGSAFADTGVLEVLQKEACTDEFCGYQGLVLTILRFASASITRREREIVMKTRPALATNSPPTPISTSRRDGLQSREQPVRALQPGLDGISSRRDTTAMSCEEGTGLVRNSSVCSRSAARWRSPLIRVPSSVRRDR